MKIIEAGFVVVVLDGDKESDGPSESGDNTSESTQGASSEPAQEKGVYYQIYQSTSLYLHFQS